MTPPSCSAVRDWLQLHSAELPPAQLVDHVASCALCRGALAVLLIDARASADPPLTCEQCEEALAEYIEYEQSHGADAAARRYPQIWRHLWLCPECAEQSAIIRALLQAEHAGRLPAIPVRAPDIRRPSIPPFNLSLRRIHSVAATRQALGAAWSGADETLLISEEQRGELTMTASIQLQGSGWRLELAVTPPISGQIVIHAGPKAIQATLDSAGRAWFAESELYDIGDDHVEVRIEN